MKGGWTLLLVLAGLAILFAGFYFSGDVKQAIRDQMIDAEWWNPIEGMEDSLNFVIVYGIVMAIWAALGVFLLLFGMFDNATIALILALAVGFLVGVVSSWSAIWNLTFGAIGG